MIKMNKFRNKYRISSARAPFWNYGWKAAYFVTVCTHNRACWFGEISNGEMALSEIGEIADGEWLKTFKMRPDMNLWMGEYVVMPNHFHAIIGIGDNEYNMRGADRGGGCRDAMHCVSTGHTGHTGKSDDNKPPQNQFGPQRKNLSSIIRGFKIGVTKNARLINPDFGWQSRFHDHIIRDERSYRRISNYIINNPRNWEGDKFYDSDK